jgi:hypothetical protein
MTADVVTATGTVIAAIAAIAAVVVASVQLKSLADSSRLSGLGAVLAMESEINSRGESLDEFSFKFERAIKDGSIPSDQIELYEGRVLALTDTYLNSVDRLAFCILRGYLPEKDWRGEYELLLKTLLSDGGLPTAKNFDNIVRLHAKWNDPSQSRMDWPE